MATELKGQDSVSPSGMLSGQSVYAGYGRGTYTNMAAVEARFPGKKYLSVSPYVTTGVDCLDIEPGDSVPGDAPAFVRNWHKVNTVKPVLYASLYNMPAVVSALSNAGIARSQYFLWVAHYDGVASIPQGYDGKQYWNTSGYDADLFYDYMFAGVAPSAVWPLKQGSTGPQVTALQTLLNQLAKRIGLKTLLTVDGNFGPATLAAVMDAQHTFGYGPPTVLGQVTEAYYAGLEHQLVVPPVKPPVPVPVHVPNCLPVTGLKLLGEGPHSYKIEWEYTKQDATKAGSFEVAVSQGSHLGAQVKAYPRTVKFTKLGLYTGQFGGVDNKHDYIVAVRAVAADGHSASGWTTVKLPKK